MAKHAVAKIVARDITQDESYASWGVQREWAELLPLAWKSIGNGTYSIAFSPKMHTPMAWWFMPLHLLAVGLGWTNIDAGLRMWRLEGYPPAHPILAFLRETHGPSIEALEIWLDLGGSFMIREALWGIAGPNVVMQRIGANLETFEMASEKYQKRIQGTRTQAGFDQLLTGDNDPLHLGDHFYQCVFNRRPNSGSWSLRFYESHNSELVITANLESMDGILRFLKEHVSGHISTSNESERTRLLVNVEDIGLNFQMAYCVESERWYLSSSASPAKRDVERAVHLWGNPRRD